MVVVEGVKMTALIYNGSQISSLTEGFCTEMGVRILQLRNVIGGMLHLEGIGGISILNKEYVQANLTIPDLPQYNEDILFLVISDHKYGERVHVQIGTRS